MTLGSKSKYSRLLHRFNFNSNYYNSYDEAAKVAGHDLKGASHFLSKCLSQPDNIKITPPLMVTVEYIGIKLLAMTCLPIKGAETLVHGTPDRAKTVAKCNEEITNKLGFVKRILFNIIPFHITLSLTLFIFFFCA